MSGPEVFHFDEVFKGDTEPAIQFGTVGWDDEDEWVSQGTGDNGGYTFIRVQLFRGRDHSKPLTSVDASVGHGTKLICSISSGLFRIPPKGTRCYVAIPAGMGHTAGVPCIIATVEKSSFDQFNKDRVYMDFGPDTHVIIKGKSVSLSDYGNRFMGVGTPRSGGTPGLLFQAADGSGGVINEGVVSWFVASSGDAKTIIQMTPTGISFVEKTGGQIMTMEAGKWCTVATECKLTGGAVYLGRTPVLATPALYGPTGVAGVASLSVFISP